MKQIRSPRCRGSKQDAPPTGKQARCPFCANLVAVQSGRLCEHWWSKRGRRYDSRRLESK